ncbi:MAG: winged helix-turn-helix transcriptional regulator [Myxococcota bacterium]
MRSYSQYCPISRASEVLGERWTMLIVRNMLLGCTSFTAIAQGVPGMSRSLLSARLRALESAGIIESRAKSKGRGRAYQLTEAGHELWDVLRPMAAWGARWIERQPQHANPSFVLWAWVHVHLRKDRLPDHRTVVEFEFPDEPPAHRRFWVHIEPPHAELCNADPGFEVDLYVTARSEAFTRWHIGELSWSTALRRGSIRVDGPRKLARAFPTWNEGAQLA